MYSLYQLYYITPSYYNRSQWNKITIQFVKTFGSRNGKYPRTGKPHGPGSLLGEELIQSAIHAFTEKQFVMKYSM